MNKRALLICIIILFCLSCDSIEPEDRMWQSSPSNQFHPYNKTSSAYMKEQYYPIGNVEFSYSAKDTLDIDVDEWGNDNRVKVVLVKVEIYNANKHPVFYLSSSCAGDQNRVLYDTSKYARYRQICCNASFPFVVEIPPGDSYRFQVDYKKRNPAIKSIKLGFNISVSAVEIDPKNYRLLQNIKSRMIWGEEVLIQR